MLDRKWMLDHKARIDKQDEEFREKQQARHEAHKREWERDARHFRWGLILFGTLMASLIGASTIVGALIKTGAIP